MIARSSIPRWVWPLALGVGVAGCLLGGALLLLPLALPTALGNASVALVGYGLIGLVLGTALCVVGFRSWHGHAARPLYSRWGWAVFLVLSLIAGVIALSVPGERQSGYLFGPFHFAMITFPGLLLFFLISLAAGSEAAISVRRMVAGVAGGASSILLAIPGELIGVVLSGLIATGVATLLPGGVAELERLAQLLTEWMQTPPTNEAELLDVLLTPVVLITLGLALALVTPVVEEFGKTLVMGLFGIWTRPRPLSAFLVGVASGLGFAWFEGIGNGALGLTEAWGGSVVVRFLATGMHALTGGIVGLGWGWYWQRRRWALPLSYALAVLLHGLWNLNVVLSLAGVGLSSESALASAAVVALGFAIQSGLVLLVLTSLFVIPVVLRWRSKRGKQ